MRSRATRGPGGANALTNEIRDVRVPQAIRIDAGRILETRIVRGAENLRVDAFARCRSAVLAQQWIRARERRPRSKLRAQRIADRDFAPRVAARAKDTASEIDIGSTHRDRLVNAEPAQEQQH